MTLGDAHAGEATPPMPSPLHAVHEALGARFVAFAGWSMPLRYGSELAEHEAVRRAAGVFDLCHMAEIAVTGPGAAEALDAALVGWFSALDAGRARYTMCCDDTGGVLDDLVVYRVGPEEFVVVANAANRPVVAGELERRCAGFAATVADTSEATGLVAIQGPVALAVAQRVCDVPLEAVRPYGCVRGRLGGADALVGRTGYTGEDGVECFVPVEAAAGCFSALLEAGESDGVVPAGLAARDSLRLEAGMALYGNELSRDVTPYEAGLGRVVRLDKPGEFTGRVALAAREAEGVRRRLVGLTGDGRRAARHGYGVVDTRTGEPVGEVTSGALSPTLGVPIAMAYVDLAHADDGTRVAVDVRGDRVEMAVGPLPFYRRRR